MRLFRISNIAALAGAVAFGTLLFWASQSVQQAEDELQDLQRSLASEQETMRVLSVEWDYLTRPSRLEELAGQHLDLQAPGAAQLVGEEGFVPKPRTPVIPHAKPVFGGAIPVSTGSASPVLKKVEPAIIDDTGERNFNDLLQDLNEGQDE